MNDDEYRNYMIKSLHEDNAWAEYHIFSLLLVCCPICGCIMPAINKLIHITWHEQNNA